MEIAVIITCGLLNQSVYEIDRFKRLMICLKRINDIYVDNDIDIVYAEFGKEEKLKNTILKNFDKAKYTFFKSEQSFDQVELWKKAIEDFPNYDFYGFLHSDIYLSDNFFIKLKERLIDANVNYYACRLHYYRPFSQEHFYNKNEIILYKNIVDYGFKYILDIKKRNYNTLFKFKTFDVGGISRDVSNIPSAFICLSKQTIEKLKLERIISYHNDVMIRDFSILLDINYEWLNDDIVFLHLNGLDDKLKTSEKDYIITETIISKYPELSFYGMFRFHPNNIPYMNNLLNCKIFIYENYIKGKLCETKYQKDLERWVYEN